METQEALIKCLQTAKDAGVPQDQAEHFLNVGHVPLPWQWKFHAAAREADKPDGPVDIGAGGARGPGKSHAVLAQAGLDDCQRVPGLKGLFLRQTGIAAQESFDDLVMKVIAGHVPYKKTGATLSFPNKSRIILGGFQDQNDIDKYIGIEYDFIIVEELNQLTEDKYTKLRGSLRTSKMNWRPRMYTSFNPGGIGHAFVKARYVLPHRAGTEKETRFIPSTYKSNPYLNKEYIDYLESLVGDLGKAWREGEWEIFAGQFFSEWRFNTHTCQPFRPLLIKDMPYNVIIGGLDWGRAKPFSFHLAEVTRPDLEGIRFHRVRVFFEVYGIEKSPAEWWDVIGPKLKRYGMDLKHITWVQADTKIFSKGEDNSVSIRDQFVKANEEFRRILKPASKDRIAGWTVYHDWLRIAPDGMPYYQVSTECPELIRTLPELQHDDLKVEDVDSDGEDHAGDDQRYMLKKIKWIDAGALGRVNHPQQNTVYMPQAPRFIKGKQLSVDLDAFGDPNATVGEVGGIFVDKLI